MKVWDVPDADKYLKIAIDSAFERVEGRLKERGRPLDSARKLRRLYQK